MASEALGMTGRMTAAGRALESRRADRLFDDPLAAVLAGEDGVAWMDEMRPPGAPVENPTIAPRTSFFDDLVINAVRDGLRQVVLVAAGMDTRAFRLALPADTFVFELEKEKILVEKQAPLDREQAVSRCERRPVPADLIGADWPAALIGAGFDPATPACFLIEGLTYYLPADTVGVLVDRVSELAVVGSRLGVDMVSRAYLDNPAIAPFFERAAARAVYWQFGTDDPVGFLAAHDWTATIATFDAVGRSLGRWPPPGVPDDVADRAALAGRSWFITANRST